MERIRWGNVARLGLAVAAGLLIAVGPRGCSGKQQAVAPLPRGVAPVPAPAPRATRAPRSAAPVVPRPRRRHVRKRKQLRQHVAAAPVPQPIAPPPAAPRRVAPAPQGRPSGGGNEFF
ncbi:MAG: hypothetical protein ACJ768_21350 [Gaiellaceae bacterium]